MSTSQGKWTNETARAMLQRNGVSVSSNVIQVSKANPPGLGCWGAIDFLKQEGYVVERT